MNFLVRSVVVRIDVPGGGTAASGGDGTSLNGFNRVTARYSRTAAFLLDAFPYTGPPGDHLIALFFYLTFILPGPSH